MTVVTLLVVTVLGLGGIIVLVLGYRGRRIDDHPLCRKCRFDLTGLPPSSSRCPECGANIRDPGATRCGNRQRRPRLLMTGWFVTVPALLIIGTLIYISFAGVPLIRYEPLFMLKWDLQNTNPKTSGPALVEISRRVALGQLHERDLAPLADMILDWQADPAHPWQLKWGDLLQDCFDRALLSQARWDRFLAQAIAVSFQTSPKVHHGANFEVWITPESPRFNSSPGRGGIPQFQMAFTVNVKVEGVGDHYAPGPQPWYGGGGSWGDEIRLGSTWRRIAQGPHEIHIAYVLEFTYHGGGRGVRSGEQTLTFESVPPETPLVKVNHDPAVKAAMFKAIWFNTDQPRTDGPPKIPLPPATLAATAGGDITMHRDDPPMRGSFSMELVQGDIHWPFEYEVAVFQGMGTMASTNRLNRSKTPATLPHPGPAEIVLTPDPHSLNPDATPVSLRHPPIDLTEIFGEELRFPITLIP